MPRGAIRVGFQRSARPRPLRSERMSEPIRRPRPPVAPRLLLRQHHQRVVLRGAAAHAVKLREQARLVAAPRRPAALQQGQGAAALGSDGSRGADTTAPLEGVRSGDLLRQHGPRGVLQEGSMARLELLTLFYIHPHHS